LTRLGRRGGQPTGLEPEPDKPPWWRRPAIVVPIAAALLAFAGGAAYGVVNALHRTPQQHPSARTTSKKPSPKPSRSPGAKAAPQHVHVAHDGGKTVSLAWQDPSHGRYPYVVLGGPTTQKANAATHTKVTGLDPGHGYCFRVAAVLSVTGKLATSTPVCVRGATPSAAPTSASP
jgi:hypothetical protein